MSFTWHEIHENLMHSSFTLSFQQEFETFRQKHQPLACFPDPGAVLDMLHDRSGASEAKNKVLNSLVNIAQSGGTGADCALKLLLLAIWPGLDAIMRRSLRRKLARADELPSEILARATEAVRYLDSGRVKWIAATILRNIERDIVRACQRETCRQQQYAEINPDELAPGQSTGDHGTSRDLLRDEVRRVIGLDAFLVIRVAVEGFSQIEVAEELGLSEAAARKRYQRAIRRLREEIKKNL